MNGWLKGKRGGLAALGVVALIVAGGLGWATRAALRLEREQLENQARSAHEDRVRVAMLRLDGRISAFLAREESRPFTHYSAIFAPTLALGGNGLNWAPGSVLEPSPLLQAKLEDWMLLHFQTDARGWESPQVLSPRLRTWLIGASGAGAAVNATAAREALKDQLEQELLPADLLRYAAQYSRAKSISDRVLMARYKADLAANVSGSFDQKTTPWREFIYRGGSQSKLAPQTGVSQERMAKNLALLNSCGNGEEWLQMLPAETLNYEAVPNSNTKLNTFILNPQHQQAPAVAAASAEVMVSMSPMVGAWVPTRSGQERLIVMRLVRLEEKDICQGIVLDGGRLCELLAEEVSDLFPNAAIRPARGTTAEQLRETMTTLPLRLATGEDPAPDAPGWTGLRVGLATAWAAAGIALFAAGLGGWSLIDLSERRMRFVSAVTHELRTPLTTLRLYLDMLLGGMVRGEEQKTDYLRTLDAETDRLARLVGNVLDYSRLEDQRPKLTVTSTAVADFLVQLGSTWQTRCEVAGKQLLIENAAGPDLTVQTDAGLLGQVLANLLDNALKYSREAADHRVWLRCRHERGRVIFEVEDRGPGVAACESQTIFRQFRRGNGSATVTGGVGLGLALARRWAKMLGGQLTLSNPPEGGACFRVELPAA